MESKLAALELVIIFYHAARCLQMYVPRGLDGTDREALLTTVTVDHGTHADIAVGERSPASCLLSWRAHGHGRMLQV